MADCRQGDAMQGIQSSPEMPTSDTEIMNDITAIERF